MPPRTRPSTAYTGPRVHPRREAADALGISLRTLERLAEGGKIKITKISARRCGVSDDEIARVARKGIEP
jgi:predicted site-specific integrase-resolvase